MLRILNKLAEKRTALVLMFVITGFTVLGSLIPQAHITPPDSYYNWQNTAPYAGLFEVLGLTRIFFTWYFYLPVLLFALNLSLCTWRQGKKMRVPALPALQRVPAALEKLRNRAVLQTGGECDAVLTGTAAILKKNGFRRAAASGGTLLAQKGLPGSYGMFLFHAALLLIVFGAAVTGLTRFSGYLMLGEGQTYDGRAELLLFSQRAPFYRRAGIPFPLRVDGIATDYDSDGILRNFATSVTFGDTARNHGITYNTPLIHRGYTFHQDKMGFAPRLLLRGANGETLYHGFLIVDTQKDPQGDIYRGGIQLGGLALAMEFYPDHIEYQGAHYTRSSRPANPHLLLQVNDGEEELFFGTLPLGATAEFAGHTLAFEDLRRWSGLLVVYDRGYSLIFAGFLLAFISLLLYYLFPHQYICVHYANGTLRIAGRGQRFPTAFAALFAALYEELAGTFGVREEAP